METYVAMLSNPGTTNGNANEITRDRAISDRALRRSKGGWVAPARKMPFQSGSDNTIVRGNPTDLAMSFF